MDVAIIAYHSGDEYQNSYSTARLSYYSSMIPGFPTVIFDGMITSVGGGTNLYPTYLAKYNSRISVPSSYTIEVEGTNSGMIDYELEITVEKIASAIDNPVMHVVVTESHIPEYWGGLTEVNFVERVMAPNQNGTVLDFTGGSTEEVTISFILDPNWVNEECELVVFLQDNQTKEVLQGVKYEIMDFGTTNVNDASILDVVAPQTICNENITPSVFIANYGLDNLTSLDLSIYVNGELASSIPWTGDLAYLESEVVVIPEINITIEPSNSLEVVAENPNGQDDEYPSNNTYLLTINEAPNVTGPVSLIMLLGDNPEEISWEVMDSQGNVLYYGDSYTGSPPTVIEQFDLVDPDCYSFIIYDEAGDGLTGGGVYKLYDGNNEIFWQASDYGWQDHVQFGISLTGEEEFVLSKGIEVFPNPTDQKAMVSFELLKSENVKIQVFNSTGSVVFTKAVKEYSAGKHNFKFNGEGLASGIYYLNLMIGESVEVQKLIIK